MMTNNSIRTRKTTLHVLTAFAVALIAFSTAQAVPFNYDEQVDGDLSPFGPFAAMPFDVGLNTVKGNFGFTQPGPTDWDSFGFSIPASAKLTGAAVTLSDALGNITSSKWRFRSGSNQFDMGNLLEEVQPLSPGATVFTSPPFYSNIYSISHISFAFAGSNDNNTADYEFSFRVEAIPEPSTVTLAALSLLALGRRRRGLAHFPIIVNP
jgi:uncharacterized protein (TIGR03382 family)